MNFYPQMGQYNMQYHNLPHPNFQPQDRRPSMPIISHQVPYQRRQSLPVLPIKVDKPGPGKTKCKFTPQEDRMLEQLVQEHGEGYWDDIAEQMPGRNARQCKDRWTRYLSPDLNKSEWTPEEEELLLQLVHELNFRWVHIARRFKGRTDNQIKNKWNVMKKYLDQQNGKYVRPTKKKSIERERPNIPLPPNQKSIGRESSSSPFQNQNYQQPYPQFQQFPQQPASEPIFPPQYQQPVQPIVPQPAAPPQEPQPVFGMPQPQTQEQRDPFENVFAPQETVNLFDPQFEQITNDDFFDMF